MQEFNVCFCTEIVHLNKIEIKITTDTFSYFKILLCRSTLYIVKISCYMQKITLHR